MKPASLLFCCVLAAFAAPVHAKENCSVFTANFLGLEWAEENCEQTPKIKAWMAEERLRKAAERKKELEEAANAQKAPPDDAKRK
jgi:hypothetical protein